MTPKDVLDLVKETETKVIDIRFTDLPGQVQHFSIPATHLSEDTFTEGLAFDGSSIRGFKAINESDMLLIPDPSTAYELVRGSVAIFARFNAEMLSRSRAARSKSSAAAASFICCSMSRANRSVLPARKSQKSLTIRRCSSALTRSIQGAEHLSM